MTDLYFKILARHNNLSLLPVPSQASKLFFFFFKKKRKYPCTKELLRELVAFKTAVFFFFNDSSILQVNGFYFDGLSYMMLPVQTFQQDPLILRNPDGGKWVCVF